MDSDSLHQNQEMMIHAEQVDEMAFKSNQINSKSAQTIEVGKNDNGGKDFLHSSYGL
jgi:hypothetical protein